MRRICSVCINFHTENEADFENHLASEDHILLARNKAERRCAKNLKNKSVAELEANLVCPICGIQFHGEKTFNNHIDKHKTDTTRYYCADCNRSYKQANNYYVHKCNPCDKVASETVTTKLYIRKLIKKKEKTEIIEDCENTVNTKVKKNKEVTKDDNNTIIDENIIIKEEVKKDDNNTIMNENIKEVIKEEVKKEVNKELNMILKTAAHAVKFLVQNSSNMSSLEELIYQKYASGIDSTNENLSAYHFSRRFIDEHKRERLADYVADIILTCIDKNKDIDKQTEDNNIYERMIFMIKISLVNWFEDQSAIKLEQIVITPIIHYIKSILMKCCNYQNEEIKLEFAKIPYVDLRNKEATRNFTELKELADVNNEFKKKSMANKITKIIANKLKLPTENIIDDEKH